MSSLELDSPSASVGAGEAESEGEGEEAAEAVAADGADASNEQLENTAAQPRAPSAARARDNTRNPRILHLEIRYSDYFLSIACV